MMHPSLLSLYHVTWGCEYRANAHCTTRQVKISLISRIYDSQHDVCSLVLTDLNNGKVAAA